LFSIPHARLETGRIFKREFPVQKHRAFNIAAWIIIVLFIAALSVFFIFEKETGRVRTAVEAFLAQNPQWQELEIKYGNKRYYTLATPVHWRGLGENAFVTIGRHKGERFVTYIVLTDCENSSIRLVWGMREKEAKKRKLTPLTDSEGNPVTIASVLDDRGIKPVEGEKFPEMTYYFRFRESHPQTNRFYCLRDWSAEKAYWDHLLAEERVTEPKTENFGADDGSD